MGMQVTRTLPPMGPEFSIAALRGLVAGGRIVLAAAEANAPVEAEARHGVHLRDTGFVRALPVDGDVLRVEIGFDAFWALWQETRMDYHHETGMAKFLEIALATFGAAAMEEVARYIQEVLAA